MEPRSPTAPRPPYARLGLLYAAAGLPYALVTEAVPDLMRRSGVSATTITALVADVSLPWTLKVLWAPLVDARGRRRAWVAVAQAALSALLVAWAVLLHGSLEPGTALAALLVGVAIASATQDLAADAWSLETFEGRSLGRANGIRVAVYRVGIVLGGGFLVARSAQWGWPVAVGVAAAFFAIAAVASFLLPEPRRDPSQGLALAPLVRRLLARRGIAVAIAFVLLFKAGDYGMALLVRPFLADQGWSKETVGDLYVPLVIVCAIAGGLAGGFATARLGAVRSLLVLGGAQAVSNLGFALAAATGSDAMTWTAAAIEPFCGGLGSAAFVTFLMRACDRRHAAAHYAAWTALMGLSRWLASRWSGQAKDALGYPAWFTATFFLALPALALLPALRRRGWLQETPAADANGSAV